MDCRTIDQNQVREWEDYLENNPTIAWQSYYWSEVVKKHYSAAFYPYAVFDQDRICGVMPLYIMKSIKGKKNIISVPYAVGGGVAADNKDAEAALIDAAIELYRKSGSELIVFKQYKHKLEGSLLSTDDNFYNRELDLTQGREQIFENLDHANQVNIQKAEGLGLELDYPSQDFDPFYRLLLQHHKNAGVPCVSRNWIKDLIEFKMYSLALFRHNGKLVAGTLVKEHKQSVSFPFTVLPEDNATSHMYAYNLYWQLLLKFIRDGKGIFHSGRIPHTNEAACYRLGWGGEKFKYYYQYYPKTSHSSEFKLKRGRKRQLVSALWKKLPIGVTEWLGPKVVRFFP